MEPLTNNQGAQGLVTNNQGALGLLIYNQEAQGPLTDNQVIQGPLFSDQGILGSLTDNQGAPRARDLRPRVLGQGPLNSMFLQFVCKIYEKSKSFVLKFATPGPCLTLL